MGDVVLSLVLQDRGLMPSDDQLFLAAGQRPDVFVISAPSPEAEALVKPTVAKLRAAGIHARHSYKTTKNVGKLLKDAADCRSKVAVIIESATTATVKDMAGGAQEQMPLEAVLAMFKA
jgi:histidyl-tRNA synthetase